ncbi:MAG: hypothetical protein ACYC0M_15445 [Burkholderiales bacterium]
MKNLASYLISDLGETQFAQDDPEANPVFVGVFVALVLMMVAGAVFGWIV